jgi:chemotaxis protein CheZ
VAGQRITKVTATLKFIEEHILRLKDIWGGMEKLADVQAAAQAEVNQNAKLLNGPMLEGDHGCMSQKEIDAVFAAHGSR